MITIPGTCLRCRNEEIQTAENDLKCPKVIEKKITIDTLSEKFKMTKKYFTEDELMSKFERFTAKKKIDILHEALSYMEQYNGRTSGDCICLAMGYSEAENGFYIVSKKLNEPKSIGDAFGRTMMFSGD